MKVSILLLSLVGSLAIAESLEANDCQCPQVKCRATTPFESCRCVNKAELACKKKCPGYVSTKWKKCTLEKKETTVSSTDLAMPTDPILGFPIPVLPLPNPSPLVLPLPDLPLDPGCKCEEKVCIMSYPEGCHCQWRNKKECYDKCGGVSPGINTCLDEPKRPAPLPAPISPEPWSSDLPLPDLPKVPDCQCEPAFCLQSYPDSCHCDWKNRKDCYDLCGGTSPGPNTCPSNADLIGDGPVKRAAAPETQGSILPLPVDVPEIVSGALGALKPKKCDYEERFCTQQWPQSCYCGNSNKFARWQRCGGPLPIFQNCGSSTTVITVTKTVTSTLPPPTPSPTGVKVQSCGGFRAINVPCPSGYKCVDDPYVEGSCGLACDRPGICVSEKMCGGFAGFRCPEDGQECLDDPNDDCDPKKGGADCAGLCFWPPSLRQST